MSSSDAPIIEFKNIGKTYGNISALRGVSMCIRQGEVTCILGDNGAGKSTLISIVAGLFGHDEGEYLVDGKPRHFSSPREALNLGIAAVYQTLALVPLLPVWRNFFLGSELVKGKGPLSRLDTAQMMTKTQVELHRMGIDLEDLEQPVGTLSGGQRQVVAIARAVHFGARVLILDEPTAALAEAEAVRLMDLTRSLRQDGIGIIYISHRLEEVFALADRVTVLRDGGTVSTRTASQADRGAVIRDMVGREIADLFPRRAPKLGEVRLRARGLTARGAGGLRELSDISFEVRAGEVLGIGGLMGAGRSELLLHLFGAWGERVSGTLELDGRALEPESPAQALAAGLALVAEDRRRQGLVLDHSVGFNLSLSTLDRLARGGLIDAAAEAELNERDREELRIKTPGLDARVGGLSGGNQQKVLVGRARRSAPEVLLLDEPTRGVDVGAKVEIYELINRMTERGLAVVLVSSELPELLGMSDRILMLRGGRAAGEFARAEATQEKLIAAALGQEGGA